jgi:hypothetical protein
MNRGSQTVPDCRRAGLDSEWKSGFGILQNRKGDLVRPVSPGSGLD